MASDVGASFPSVRQLLGRVRTTAAMPRITAAPVLALHQQLRQSSRLRGHSLERSHSAAAPFAPVRPSVPTATDPNVIDLLIRQTALLQDQTAYT